MYCTLSDLEKRIDPARLIDLTDDAGNGAIDQTLIDEAIAAAQGEVDGLLQKRFNVPLSTVPELVKAATVDIAIYRLFGRKLDEVPSGRRNDYIDAVRRLERIASGAIKLGLPTPPAETGTEAMQVATPARVFGDLDKY